MTKEFDNENRNRYYGLRKGDIVFLGFKSQSPRKLAEVVGYGFMDNNRVYVKTEDGEETDYVAEWCEILVKVEERQTLKKTDDRSLIVGDRVWWITLKDKREEGKFVGYYQGEVKVETDDGRTLYFEV
jgi:hypothetical protein